MKYIDADFIRKEVERRTGYISVTHFAEELLSVIDSLQQEQPEVDLDREIIRYKIPFADDREYLNETTLDAIARHFYELGIKARKL